MITSTDLIVGTHAIKAALETNNHKVIGLYCLEEKHNARLTELCLLANKHGVPVHKKAVSFFDKNFTSKVQHSGVALHIKPNSTLSEYDLYRDILKPKASLFLVLDEVQDPHNLGACLRSADCAGVSGLILPKSNTSPITMTVRKVAVGAAERIRIYCVPNLVRVLKKMAKTGFWLVGADINASQSHHDIKYGNKTVLIMGSEEKGLRHLTRSCCDDLVSIKMNNPKSNSLNVSVATGVVLFEIVRQLNVGLEDKSS